MPIGEITVDVGLDWSTAVSEFVGGIWLLRGLGAADACTYNTTTLRFISLGSPLDQQGGPTAAGATFRCSKPIQIHTFAVLFENVFPGGASASFQFNLGGVTQGGIILSAAAGDTKKVATGLIDVPQDGMLCLECTADVGGTPDIKSIGIAYRTKPGSNPDV